MEAKRTILEFPRLGAAEIDAELRFLRMQLDDKLGWRRRVAEIAISVSEAKKFIRFWHPDGCIVNNDRLPPEIFRGIPTLFLHRPPKGLPATGVAHLSYDETAIGELAARELLKLDLASYAYVPDPDEYWSAEREAGFIRALATNFKNACSFKEPTGKRNPLRRNIALVNWLKCLPKPAGVFAARDQIAVRVLEACDHAGVAVPEDVIIIGTDNSETVCETARPTISSIAFDYAECNTCGCMALNALMQRPGQRCRKIKIKPDRLVRRGSTMRLRRADKTVIAARDLIRTRACSGLNARDVAALFPCSRRMAEIRFRAATGHSILEEILAERRNRAETLISRSNLKTVGIAAQCGYAAWSSIHRLLHAGQPES